MPPRHRYQPNGQIRWAHLQSSPRSAETDIRAAIFRFESRSVRGLLPPRGSAGRCLPRARDPRCRRARERAARPALGGPLRGGAGSCPPHSRGGPSPGAHVRHRGRCGLQRSDVPRIGQGQGAEEADPHTPDSASGRRWPGRREAHQGRLGPPPRVEAGPGRPAHQLGGWSRPGARPRARTPQEVGARAQPAGRARARPRSERLADPVPGAEPVADGPDSRPGRRGERT